VKIVLVFAAVLAVALVGVLVWAWTPDLKRADLEARYLAQPGDMVEISGVRLHLRDEGPRDAPAVLLLHGFGSSLQTWDGWAVELAKTYRTVRFDLPGAGLSGPDPRNDYGEVRNIEITLAVLDRLGIARATLIGNSIGGRMAWRFAAAHPARTRALVLVSPDGFASKGFAYGEKFDAPWLLQSMRYFLPAAALRPSLLASYARPEALEDATFRRNFDLIRAPGARAALIARLEQTVLVPPEPLLARIAAPTLLLWGAQDRLIPIANADEYLRALPNATLVALPDLGHVPQEEASATSLAPVLGFLAKN
jgi:pimeloyl-ACP methyl ester carboxylesterase